MNHRETEPGQKSETSSMLELEFNENEQVTLCEVLDRVLNKGVVVGGEAVLSVAGIELIYLRLHLVLTSVETARDVFLGPHAAERKEEVAA